MEKMLSKYVEQYVNAATEHGDASEQGNAPRANRNYRRLIKARDKIEALGTEGHEALIRLLAHENPSVRGWVATHLLFTEAEKAVPVLEELERGGGLEALSAEIVLQEWRKGTLKVP